MMPTPPMPTEICQTCGKPRPCGNYCLDAPGSKIPKREDFAKAATALKAAASDQKRPLLVRAVAAVFGVLAEDLATPEDSSAEKHGAEDRPADTNRQGDT